MLKYILLIALVSAVEKTNSTESKEMKPGDLDEYYEIDFEQDPDHIDDNSNTLDDTEIMEQIPEFDENGFMNML